MIEILNLTKKFGQIKAVDNISFTVNKGEVLGFLGPNGAGKTTTMNILTGFISSTEGTVKIDGFDIMDNPKEVKKRIGYMPEQPPLYMDMTVIEYLTFISELKLVDKKSRKKQIDDILKLVRISDIKKRLIKNLSKGYKQRVGFAQTLIGNPEVLILDEPTVGLDPKQIIEIRKLIKLLGQDHTIILSSHILPEVSAICDRVVIIDKGRIVAIDTPENLARGIGPSTSISMKIEGPRMDIEKIIKGIYGVKSIKVKSTGSKEINEFIAETIKDTDIRKPLFFELAKHNFPLLESSTLDASLEDVFLQLTTQEKGVK
ncbi:MAG: ABC transporter ATP-binding protein [Clostridia bacterium]|jgi:ABC-2 type transport system ATP-binding protein